MSKFFGPNQPTTGCHALPYPWWPRFFLIKRPATATWKEEDRKKTHKQPKIAQRINLQKKQARKAQSSHKFLNQKPSKPFRNITTRIKSQITAQSTLQYRGTFTTQHKFTGTEIKEKNAVINHITLIEQTGSNRHNKTRRSEPSAQTQSWF